MKRKVPGLKAMFRLVMDDNNDYSFSISYLLFLIGLELEYIYMQQVTVLEPDALGVSYKITARLSLASWSPSEDWRLDRMSPME